MLNDLYLMLRLALLGTAGEVTLAGVPGLCRYALAEESDRQ